MHVCKLFHKCRYLQDPDQLRALESGRSHEAARTSVDIYALAFILWECIRKREAFFFVHGANIDMVRYVVLCCAVLCLCLCFIK